MRNFTSLLLLLSVIMYGCCISKKNKTILYADVLFLNGRVDSITKYYGNKVISQDSILLLTDEKLKELDSLITKIHCYEFKKMVLDYRINFQSLELLNENENQNIEAFGNVISSFNETRRKVNQKIKIK